MKIVIALIAVALLSGCVTPQQLHSALESWEGATLEQVIAQWGPPSEQVETGDMVTYSWDSFPTCDRRLTFKDGRVVAWTPIHDLQGNFSTDCPAHRWSRQQ